MKLIIITIILVGFFLFGCIEQSENLARNQFSSLSQKSILGPKNYVAEYEVFNSSGNQQMNFDSMNLFVLSNEKSNNFKVEFDTKNPVSGESMTTQVFVFYELGKVYICVLDRCLEVASTDNPVPLPTKEQINEMMIDQNLTIKFLPKISSFPEDATCFEIVEMKKRMCYLNDGIIAYDGSFDGKRYMKLITIERNTLSEDNFILPDVPISKR